MPKTYELSDADKSIMEKVKKLIVADISKHYTIPELAQSVGLNEAKLKLAFRLSTGLGLFHYLKEIRLQKAKELLDQTKNPIDNIAIRLGYKSASAFIHAFTKRFDISPNKYRK